MIQSQPKLGDFVSLSDTYIQVGINLKQTTHGIFGDEFYLAIISTYGGFYLRIQADDEEP